MFDEQKKLTLSKTYNIERDNSQKGHIDEEIRSLVDTLNDKENYYTTSSCAGRTVLLERKSTKKFDATWIFSTHKQTKFEDLKEKLVINEFPIWFKAESPILHIACRTLEDAHKILTIGKVACFKRAGIISHRKRIIVEVIGTEKIDTIIAKDGKQIVDDEYLKTLVEIANESMTVNRKNLDIFEEEINKLS